MSTELSPDAKGNASLTLKKVIAQTRQNFPDPRYQPRVHLESSQYFLGGINPYPYEVWPTADGIGTKPELAERLYTHTGDPKYFEGLAFDTFAMIESDEARFGRQLLGIANIIDNNTARDSMVSALARGAKQACDEGQFALLNGETAELSYRVSGYGESRVNWNAVGLSLVIPDKLILGARLTAGQPIVALRERSIRSNGLTRARGILEAFYLQSQGYPSKKDYVLDRLADEFEQEGFDRDSVSRHLGNLPDHLSLIMGHDFMEQVLPPWHEYDPSLTEKLLTPSRLYGKLINTAQGWGGDDKNIDIIAAAHISGGGVPEKVKRMLELSNKRLGIHIDPIFPDPEAVSELMKLSDRLPEGKQLIDDRGACEQWNRGIGFIAVTRDNSQARELVDLATVMGYEAAVAGHILDQPLIEWRGYTWTY